MGRTEDRRQRTEDEKENLGGAFVFCPGFGVTKFDIIICLKRMIRLGYSV